MKLYSNKLGYLDERTDSQKKKKKQNWNLPKEKKEIWIDI